MRVSPVNASAAMLVIVAIIVHPGSASAQRGKAAAASGNPPITWCDTPSQNPEWKRQTAHLVLDFERSDRSAAQRALRPYLPFLLSGVAKQFMADQQPSRDRAAAPAAAPPPGEPRYDPGQLREASLLFDLVGDGSVEAITTPSRGPSLIVEDLMSSLLSAIAGGEVFGPYGTAEDRSRLRLHVALDTLEGPVYWPAFTINAPIARPAMVKPGNRAPFYPQRALDWDGVIPVRYVIDEKGRAVPQSFRVIGADTIVWPLHRQRLAFEAFTRTVQRTVARMQFSPAEILGCTVRTWVVQEFIFVRDESASALRQSDSAAPREH